VATLTHSIVPALQDFGSDDGIATLVEDLLDERSARAVLGRARAAGYLSPEHVRGEKLDQRSDVFVIGCLLYERLSGVAPFAGKTKAARRAAILGQDPRDLADPPFRMPSGLARIVARCLEKHPDRRFQSTRELACALRAVDLQPPRRAARLMAVAAGALLIAALVLLTSRVDRGRWPWTPAPVQGVTAAPLVNR
jgi:serine/threonine protein kinase